MNKPPSGTMVHWRFKCGLRWHFGYVTHESGDLIRFGRWNGDSTGGTVAAAADVEWKSL